MSATPAESPPIKRYYRAMNKNWKIRVKESQKKKMHARGKNKGDDEKRKKV